MKAKQENYSFTLNYHKHDEVGGVGHISLAGKCGDEKAKISVHPSSDISVWTPLQVVSACVFPSKAVNVNEHREGDSPIHASYDITNQMSNPKAAFDEIVKLNKSIETGTTGYSLLPGYLTKSIHVLLSSQSSTSNLFLGYKMMDREKVNSEMSKYGVTNCSESVYSILRKGGMEGKPSTTCSFIRPTAFNEFAQNLCISNESVMPQNSIKSSSDTIDSEVHEPVSVSSVAFFSTARHTHRPHAPQQSRSSLPAIRNVHEFNPLSFFATKINSDKTDELNSMELGSMQLRTKGSIDE
ncbi:Uncharacterised protein [Legionella wadsworthii]|uniref:Uncharacterized protein n=1 Tax=Legionella wadsworthii TaxID=28088 RepID=A0A378LRV6_9GAMM|nr:hypothetical protein [Legionella wadsworthii]STY29686.1 Uncharacterised protein [Legionella wadsworthii]